MIFSCLVTPHWENLDPRIKNLPNLRVYQNGVMPDLKVWGRYLEAIYSGAIGMDLIYTQDDDAIIDQDRLLSMYREGELLVNMPADHQRDYAGTGIALVGWGAIFPPSMLSCFTRYLQKWPADELFLRECDRVFTYLNRDKVRIVDIGVGHLPQAFGDDRMGREARHGDDLQEIKRRLAEL